jgi:hypothetical protein
LEVSCQLHAWAAPTFLELWHRMEVRGKQHTTTAEKELPISIKKKEDK